MPEQQLGMGLVHSGKEGSLNKVPFSSGFSRKEIQYCDVCYENCNKYYGRIIHREVEVDVKYTYKKMARESITYKKLAAAI